MRYLIRTCAAGILCVMLPALAHAHAHLKSSSPADKATLAASPPAITLEFSEEIELKVSKATVTGPGNYMSKPLMPRTVRTIDLSAPVVPATPPIPTADNPHETGEEQEDEATQTDSVVPFRPPAIRE